MIEFGYLMKFKVWLFWIFGKILFSNCWRLGNGVDFVVDFSGNCFLFLNNWLWKNNGFVVVYKGVIKLF